MAERPDWTKFSAPEEVPRGIVASGMAWLLCHEVGHFGSPDAGFCPSLKVPAYATARVRDELNADHNSFHMLLLRKQGTWPTDKESLCRPLAGVSLVLRAWNLMIPVHQGRQPNILSYGDVVGAMTPSPTVRWGSVHSPFETLDKLGLASIAQYRELEQILYPDSDVKTVKLWEKFDEYGIVF